VAGISGLLGVITTRLGRSIDRARFLREQEATSSIGGTCDRADGLVLLRRRMAQASRPTTTIDFSPLVALLFVRAMGFLMAAVTLLLREVGLTHQILRHV
jgi:hypothetical protein